MTLNEAYHEAIKKLKNPQIEEINVRMLLCDINGIESMSDFYIREDEKVKDLRRFHELFDKFLKGHPIQYLMHTANFFGYDFYVDERVLIPRMESEEVIAFAIDKFKEYFGSQKPVIVDVCCGSGCLGITLARALQATELYMSDISKDAVEVARKNLGIHKMEGKVYIGDSLQPIVKNEIKCDVLIANPPYILKKSDVDKSVLDYEPKISLFTNKRLYVYDQIMSNISKVAKKPFLAVFEIGYDIVAPLENMVNKYFHKCDYEFRNDMNGNARMLSIYLK